MGIVSNYRVASLEDWAPFLWMKTDRFEFLFSKKEERERERERAIPLDIQHHHSQHQFTSVIKLCDFNLNICSSAS